MKRLRQLCCLKPSTIVGLARRNSRRQTPQRKLELDVRVQAVTLSTVITSRGWTRARAADLLRLSPRTLRQWQSDFRRQRLRSLPLGRPLLRSVPQERKQVFDLLEELGPLTTPLTTLQESFPNMPRAELADLLRRYQRVWLKRHPQTMHRLRWLVPGRVWAIDFKEAPQPIDGIYPYLLAVRDLASGYQLLWQPVHSENAAVVETALAWLFVLHGAPLVLKMDNGPAFLAELVAKLLEREHVSALVSPPYTPEYNGSIEAGICSLATRTEAEAARQGRPTFSTWEDAAVAQHKANETARPRGPRGPTPGQLWRARTPILPAERTLFRDALARHRTEARREAGFTPEETLKPWKQRALDRCAIRRALVERGYLYFWRRRIPLLIAKKKVARIT